jgi:hypothetical protein
LVLGTYFIEFDAGEFPLFKSKLISSENGTERIADSLPVPTIIRPPGKMPGLI